MIDRSSRLEASPGDKRDELLNDGTVFLTILMPCLNEQDSVPHCINLAHEGCRRTIDLIGHGANDLTGDGAGNLAAEHFEILIADNGSTDDSVAIARSCGARVVHVTQRGYGAALRGGIAASRGRYVLMGDCDGSYDFREAPRFVEQLSRGFALVVGNRFSGTIAPGAMPWHHRWIGNPLLSRLGRLCFRTSIRDWHCGLRAIDRERWSRIPLSSTGMEFASEMVMAAAKHRLPVTEITTRLNRDLRPGRPHLRSLPDGLRHIALIARNRLNFRRTLSSVR